jgi:hypothetical protein
MLFDNFHQFSQFSIDIRLLIWQEALPGPRVVTVEFVPIYDERDYLQSIGYYGCFGYYRTPVQTQLEQYGFTSSRPQPPLPPRNGVPISGALNRQQWNVTSPTKIPSLRYVCRESASLMQSQGWVFALQTVKSAPVYINFALDTLYIWDGTGNDDMWYWEDNAEQQHSPLSWFSPRDLQLVRKVAFYWRPTYLDMDSSRLPLRSLQFFNTLDSCSRVIHDVENSYQNFSLQILGEEIMDFTKAEDKPQLPPDHPKTHSGMVAYFHKQMRRWQRLEANAGRPLIDFPRRMAFATAVDGNTGRWTKKEPQTTIEVESYFCPFHSEFRVDTWLTIPGDSCNCLSDWNPADIPWLRLHDSGRGQNKS